MSDIFGNSGGIRGCFAHVSFNAGASRGAQLIMPAGDPLPTSELSDPLLCVGFTAQMQETVLFNKCFGNRVYTYAFGHNPNASQLTVNLLGFLVDHDSYSGVVDDVLGAYRESRVSVAQDYALLSLGDSKPMRGFVTGISSNTIDPKHSLQMFAVHMQIPGVQ
jgi:hypothetical protein